MPLPQTQPAASTTLRFVRGHRDHLTPPSSSLPSVVASGAITVVRGPHPGTIRVRDPDQLPPQPTPVPHPRVAALLRAGQAGWAAHAPMERFHGSRVWAIDCRAMVIRHRVAARLQLGKRPRRQARRVGWPQRTGSCRPFKRGQVFRGLIRRVSWIHAASRSAST